MGEKTLKELKNEYVCFTNEISNYLDKLKSIIGIEQLEFSFVEIDEVLSLYSKHFLEPEQIDLNDRV